LSVFIRKKKYNALLMLVAFAFLLISNVHFVFSALNNEANYIISHAIELTAYLLILVNLILVRKNEQKKK
jgi:hypothetical protein